MNYRPYNKTSSTPSHDSLRRICRGNMIPVLHFLLSRVKEKVEKERDVAEKEVEKLRRIVRRKRKELQGIMCEVSREECERKRMLDQRSNSRSSESTSIKKSLRCWFGSSDQIRWNEHPFCTNRMVGSKRHHIVPFGELNGVPIAFVARQDSRVVIVLNGNRLGRLYHDLTE
nr:hypothetical protein [Tanacetum cinerariifolium]